MHRVNYQSPQHQRADHSAAWSRRAQQPAFRQHPEADQSSASVSFLHSFPRWEFQDSCQYAVSLPLWKIVDSDCTIVVSNKELTTTLTQLRRQGQWPEALRVFEYYRRKLQFNTINYNAAISACEKGRRWELALELLEECKT